MRPCLPARYLTSCIRQPQNRASIGLTASQCAVVPMRIGCYAKYDSLEFRVFVLDPSPRTVRGPMWPPCPANQRGSRTPTRGARLQSHSPCLCVNPKPSDDNLRWTRFPAGHGVLRSNLSAAGADPAYCRLLPTRAARAADRKSSRSPSSTAWMSLVSTSVRRSFTIW